MRSQIGAGTCSIVAGLEVFGYSAPVHGKEDGESITGTLLGRGPNGVPISGTFKDGKLQFVIVPPAATATPSRPFPKMSYEGTYQDGKHPF